MDFIRLRERLLHIEVNARALVDDRFHEAGEQNGISKALLAVEKDGLTGESGLAVPKRLHKIGRLHLQFGNAPASLIIRPTALEIPHRKMNDGFIKYRLRGLRLKLARALKIR